MGTPFTMTPPQGAADPEVAYDFTTYNSGLTLVQNFAAANLSNDNNYDLEVECGSPVYVQAVGLGTKPVYAPPLTLGWGLKLANATRIKTVAATPGVALTGALTVEWVGQVLSADPYGFYLFLHAGMTETLEDNSLYQLWYDPPNSGMWGYTFERGGGVNYDTDMITSAGNPEKNLFYLALTRNSNGVTRLYANGKDVSGAKTPSPAAPEGGSNGRLKIGDANSGSAPIVHYGLRVFASELTAAQIEASFRTAILGL